MPLLPFDYDSSYTDTGPYEPKPGGCCTWLPFTIGELVELPITLPEDHTLFELLQETDETTWIEKARFIKEKQGLALMNTHPDYMANPHVLPAYDRFLQAFKDDETAWKPLPRELSEWWRARSASRIESAEGGWTIVGPASDRASVLLREGRSGRPTPSKGVPA
jgi:hypothetical protein